MIPIPTQSQSCLDFPYISRPPTRASTSNQPDCESSLLSAVDIPRPLICSFLPIDHSLTCPCSFINGEFVKGVDGKTFEVINPSTEEVITSVHEATEKDVDIAVAAARKAFDGSWRKETPENRGRLLVKLADLFEKNLDLLAGVESLDNGKAITMAKVDIGMSAGCLRYYGGWADKIEGKVIDTTPDTFNYVRKEPVRIPSSSSYYTRP